MGYRWIVPVEASDVKDGLDYFLATRPKNPEPMFQTYMFQSSDLHGKICWSVKPGIAIRYKGCDDFRSVLDRRPDLVAVQVPADADKRWKRRQRRF